MRVCICITRTYIYVHALNVCVHRIIETVFPLKTELHACKFVRVRMRICIHVLHNNASVCIIVETVCPMKTG